MADELTTRILTQIRDGITGLRQEVKEELHGLRQDLSVLAKLTQGIDTRLSHVEDDVQQVRRDVREQTFLGRRVTILEQDMAALLRRTEALEKSR